jgi:hypothetical protein
MWIFLNTSSTSFPASLNVTCSLPKDIPFQPAPSVWGLLQDM